MTTKTYPYDSADYLDDEEAIALFAEEELVDDDPKLLDQMVRVVIRAHGLNALAASTGIPRRALIDALSGQNPDGAEVIRSALAAAASRTAQQRPSRIASLAATVSDR